MIGFILTTESTESTEELVLGHRLSFAARDPLHAQIFLGALGALGG